MKKTSIWLLCFTLTVGMSFAAGGKEGTDKISYIKRVNSDTYWTYNRGAMGIAGHALKDEDHALKLVHANTLDKMPFNY